MSIDVLYCGEYTKINSLRLPAVGDGLILFTPNDTSLKQHLFRITNLADFKTLDSNKQIELLRDSFYCSRKSGIIEPSNYLIEILEGNEHDTQYIARDIQTKSKRR